MAAEDAKEATEPNELIGSEHQHVRNEPTAYARRKKARLKRLALDPASSFVRFKASFNASKAPRTLKQKFASLKANKLVDVHGIPNPGEGPVKGQPHARLATPRPG